MGDFEYVGHDGRVVARVSCKIFNVAARGQSSLVGHGGGILFLDTF